MSSAAGDIGRSLPGSRRRRVEGKGLHENRGLMMNTSQDRYRIPPMKASDADRDQVLAVLSENYQAGRLTSDELEDRTGRALSARTLDELDALTADLPAAGPTGVTEPDTAGQPSWPGFARLPVIVVAIAVLLIAGVVLGTTAVGHAAHFLWLLIAVPIVVRRMALRRGGQPGPGRGVRDRRRGPWMLD
jgi:hypothetical protein